MIMGASGSDELLPAIDAVLRDAGVAPRDVRAIACGSGPGSFTSLRVAAAVAKGFAVANSALLFAIPSLLLAGAALYKEPGFYILHSDALRGDRYAQAVRIDEHEQAILEGNCHRVSLPDLETNYLSASPPAVLVAVGEVPFSASDSRSVQAHARNVLALRSAWPRFGPVDAGTWEPEYGRAAEAQVKWEVLHGKPLPAT